MSALMTHDQFAQILPRIWTAATSALPQEWSASHPSRGQCAVTAALASEVLGYEMRACTALKPHAKSETHYLNWQCGAEAVAVAGAEAGEGALIDFTSAQFLGPVTFSEAAPKDNGLGSTRISALSHPDTLLRYARLRDAFFATSGASVARQPWLLLDLDNTLIAPRQLYNTACQTLAEHAFPNDPVRQHRLIKFAMGSSRQLLDQAGALRPSGVFARSAAAPTNSVFAFSPARFPLALVMALASEKPEAKPEDVQEAWALGQLALSQPAPLKPHACALVRDAQGAGYKIGIITAGNEELQRRRLRELPFIRDVDAVLVVQGLLNETSFHAFIRAHGVDAGRSIYVANKLSSELYPASKTGLKLVWFTDDQDGGSPNEAALAEVRSVSCLRNVLD